MSEYEFSFEKLIAWQKARSFVTFIYKITSEFPKEEKYGLVSQIRRAGISVPANLAEGSARISQKDQARYTQIAYSSMMEVLNHFYIAMDLGYINESTFAEIKLKINELSKLLNAYRNAQLNQ